MLSIYTRPPSKLVPQFLQVTPEVFFTFLLTDFQRLVVWCKNTCIMNINWNFWTDDAWFFRGESICPYVNLFFESLAIRECGIHPLNDTMGTCTLLQIYNSIQWNSYYMPIGIKDQWVVDTCFFIFFLVEFSFISDPVLSKVNQVLQSILMNSIYSTLSLTNFHGKSLSCVWYCNHYLEL